MKSAAFDYFAAKTVAETTSVLGQSGGTAMVIAGGQSLVPMLNLRVALPDLLVDIGRLGALKTASATRQALAIGALVTHADIEDGAIPDPFGGLLRKIAAGISYRAVRHHGTIGGSVALADPAADWPVVLLALNAAVKIASRGGTRLQSINDFLKGQYTTSLAQDEIIVGFDIEVPDAPMRWGASKVVRKSGAFASSIAVVAERGKVAAAALGAAGPRPYLLPTTAQGISSGAPVDKLRAMIEDDLKALALDGDAYLTRLHTSTVMRAVREMRQR